jgi:TfoX/Sxy family transcriptional regulator of competence genes
MAYDEDLADRIRELLAGEPDVLERRMFGGLAFLVGGSMAVAASGQGGIVVRVGPEESDALVASTGARPMEMRGRPMRGWLRVDEAGIGSDDQLAEWVGRGVALARSAIHPSRPSAGKAAPSRQTPPQPASG